MIKYFISLGLAICSIAAFSQSNQESLNLTYWNLRSDFQKRFTLIGEGPGYSIPIAALDPADHYGTGCSQNNISGISRFGDEPQLQGYYLAMLATEYALKGQADQETNSTLNELYYALRAINRLDEQAEFYLSQNQSGTSLNGLLCRDDVPSTYMNEFVLNQYPITLDVRDLRYPCVESDGYDMEWECCPGPGVTPGAFNKGNYMSQDHVFNLLMGLAMVKRYVPDIFVKPTVADQGFFLVDETKAITMRIMNYITSAKTFNEDVCGLSFPDVQEIQATWSICNPFTNTREHPVSELHVFSYPLALAAQNITGTNYSNLPVTWMVTDPNWWQQAYIFCRPQYIMVPSDWANFWSEIGNLPTYNYTINYPVVNCVLPMGCTVNFTDHETAEWPQLRMNAYLTMLIGSLSGVIPHNKITQMGDEFGKSQILDLVYSTLHNDIPVRPASFYENLLLLMPCEGPFNNDAANTAVNDESWPWNTTMYWSQGQSQGQPYDGSLGEYNGLDWMLLYNLYRLNFNTGYSAYSDNSCPCDGSNAKIDLSIDGSNNLNSGVVLDRKFPQYLDLDIKLKEYLTHDLQIVNATGLGTNTDLVVCNNSTVEVQGGGFLFAASSANDEGPITFRKGSTLHLKGGSVLTVNDRCKVVIEEGAHLIFDQNAEIRLLGDNAVLEIAGDLTLGVNAVFTFVHPNANSGYVKFSRTSWVPYDPLDPDYQIIVGAGATMSFMGDSKTDKVLEIAQNALWIPDALTQFVVDHGTVEFANGIQPATLSIGAPDFTLTDAQFYNGPNNYAGNGVITYGQAVHHIQDCLFEGLQTGLTALNFYGAGSLKLDACHFTSCGTGLVVYDKGVTIAGCVFDHCLAGADLLGLTFNSTITNTQFNHNYETGLNIKGSPIEVKMQSCQMSHNSWYGVAVSGSTLNLACCAVKSNGVYGMLIDYDAVLRMSPTYGGGNNDIGNNDIPILLNEAQDVEISGGRNNLKPQVAPPCGGNPNPNPNTNCPDVFQGTIQAPCVPYTIAAKQNKWKQDYSNWPVQFDNQNFSDLPLSVNSVTAVGCGTPVRFTDPNQLPFASCPNGPPNGGGGPPSALTPLNNCTNCNMINTQSFVSVTTDSAARTAIDRMDTSLVNGYSDAVGLFNEILMYPLSGASSGDAYVIRASRRKIHESLGGGIERGQVQLSLTTLSPEASKVIQVEADEVIKGDQSGDYHRKFFAAMREAQAYRASGKRDVALQKLDDILTWVLPAEYPYAQEWRCLTYNELQVLSGIADKENFGTIIQPCFPSRMPPPASLRSTGTEESEEENVPMIITHVFPNPAQDALNIQIENAGQDELYTFELYAGDGRLVKQSTINGSSSVAIDVAILPRGIYFYRIVDEDFGVSAGKIVLD